MTTTPLPRQLAEAAIALAYAEGYGVTHVNHLQLEADGSWHLELYAVDSTDHRVSLELILAVQSRLHTPPAISLILLQEAHEALPDGNVAA